LKGIEPFSLKIKKYFREKEEDALLGKFVMEFQKRCERSHGDHVVQSSQHRSVKIREVFYIPVS